jgi:hypothetical protein
VAGGVTLTLLNFPVGALTAAQLNQLVAAVRDNHEVRLADLEALGGDDGKATPSTNTTSASYVTVTGAPVATFTKRRTDTRIVVWLHTEVFNATASTATLGVQVAGTDYDVKSGPVAVPNTRQSYDGVIIIPAGVAAGAVTVTPRWKTSGGTLTTSQTSWTIYAEERF